MSASDDQAFVSKTESAQQPYADDAAAKREDDAVAESEATGKISKDEVEGLKDSIGGGEVLDDSEGYTRSTNKADGYADKEKELDAAVEEAQ